MTTTLVLRDCIEDTSERFAQADLFYGHGTDNPWDEAVYLVFSALGVSFLEEDSVMRRVITAEEAGLVAALVNRRITEHIPVAYLVGEAWFGGLPFKVDNRVLIPRSPIAELIADRFAALLSEDPLSILDLCTGSGCIGIACALAFPAARVDLADISEDALSLARENAQRHAVQGRVRVIQADLFGQLTPGYDLIVTNPPYVSRDEVDELPPEYRHEPDLGLVSDDNGLDIPVQILRQAAEFLNENGALIMEVGYSWTALANRFPAVPFLWLAFANGGEGVCLLTRQQLLDSAALFN